MPKMTGVETFKQLKEISGFNTPVVILTANAISGMKEKYMSIVMNKIYHIWEYVLECK